MLACMRWIALVLLGLGADTHGMSIGFNAVKVQQMLKEHTPLVSVLFPIVTDYAREDMLIRPIACHRKIFSSASSFGVVYRAPEGYLGVCEILITTAKCPFWETPKGTDIDGRHEFQTGIDGGYEFLSEQNSSVYEMFAKKYKISCNSLGLYIRFLNQSDVRKAIDRFVSVDPYSNIKISIKSMCDWEYQSAIATSQLFFADDMTCSDFFSGYEQIVMPAGAQMVDVNDHSLQVSKKKKRKADRARRLLKERRDSYKEFVLKIVPGQSDIFFEQ